MGNSRAKLPLTTRALRWLALLAPWIVAAACYFFVPAKVWGSAATGLIGLLSLIAAATLLRVMRAFPITDPDGFVDKEEIESLEFAVRRVMRSLAFAVAISLVAIFLLVFRGVLSHIVLGIHVVDSHRGAVYSAAVGWSIAFVALRITYVVRMDFSIFSQQARAVRRVFEKRRAREIAEARRRNEDLDFDFKDEAPYPGRKEAEH